MVSLDKARCSWRLVSLALCLTCLLISLPAWAGIRFDGLWTDADRPVTLRADQVSRQQALQLFSEATGWSIVSQDLGEDRVDLAIVDQPAAKVLEMLLPAGDYVASRQGDRVRIEPLASKEDASAAQEPPRKKRVVLGRSLRIERGEHVMDVEVLGGHLDILGVVEEDVVVLGGQVRVHDGAHVKGDVSVIGGALHLLGDSRVDGDVDVLGGGLHRSKSAKVGGTVSGLGNEVPTLSFGNKTAQPQEWTLARMTSDASHALKRTALLFLFGVVLWALGSRRMEALEVEIAKRPMRSLAMGVVGILMAALAFLVLVLTLVGIPFAVGGAMITIVAAYAGACVVLSTLGQALLRHKTENRTIHLAVGCVLFLMFTAIPYVGSLIWLGVLLMGLGAVVTTRGAGVFPSRPKPTECGPYRTATA